MKIDSVEHSRHDWRAHALLPDFEVEDVWRFPVELRADQSLELFREQFQLALESASGKGPAGVLFRLRRWLGDVFGWDKKDAPELARPGSIRERYAREEGLRPEDLPPPGEEDFQPVYQLENESFAEIENATVHAGLHLGRVPLDQNTFGVQMAVYVKPKGIGGRFYMALIKPFRLLIVYPAIMKMARKQWAKMNRTNAHG